MKSIKFYNSDLYEIEVKHFETATILEMKIKGEKVNTKDYPQTKQTLEVICPSVLKTRCFNDAGLGFVQEVERTELGHLFEHILIDKIREIKEKGGERKCTFKGVTEWDWRRETKGTFHIFISAGVNDIEAFYQALDKTIETMNVIMTEEPMVFVFGVGNTYTSILSN